MPNQRIDIEDGYVVHESSYLTVDGCDVSGAEVSMQPISFRNFQAMIEEHAGYIEGEMQQLYEANIIKNEYGAITHPWLNVIKIASARDTFTHGLEVVGLDESAVEIVPRLSHDFERHEITKHHHPYLNAIDATDFVWRVSCDVSSRSIAQSGLWLKIKHRQHVVSDVSYGIFHALS